MQLTIFTNVDFTGAYTDQLITVDTTHGNAIIYSDATTPDGLLQWWLNGTIANGTSTVVDGAKRDRLVWSADMSISVPAIAVSTYDLISIQTAFDALFGLQSADGQIGRAHV